MPASEDEVNAALRRLDAERAEIVARVSTFAERERQLVEADADDDALDALDAAHRRDRRDLERLAVREEALVEHAARLRGASMRVAQADLVARYETQLIDTMRAYRAAGCARWKLVELREEAVQAGLEKILPRLPLPNVNMPLTEGDLSHFEGAALRDLRSLSAVPDPTPQYHVRFIEGSTLGAGEHMQYYRVGDVACFSRENAAALVERGVAVWFLPPSRDEGHAP